MTLAISDCDQMLACISRLNSDLAGSSSSLDSLASLVRRSEFGRLLRIHNTIQAAQCFQCPPMALCCDSRALVAEASNIVQNTTYYTYIKELMACGERRGERGRRWTDTTNCVQSLIRLPCNGVSPCPWPLSSHAELRGTLK